MSFEEFQDGCHGDHLGYWNRTILAILNLHVTPMPPIKFQLIRTFRGGGDVVQRISTAAMAAFLDIGTEVFSNSESPCHPNDSHRFSSIPLLVREEMLFEEFQDSRHGGHYGYLNRMISAILNLHVTPMPPIKFRLNPTIRLGGDVI